MARKLRVLLAEDSIETRRFFVKILKKFFRGTLDQAEDGKELVEKIRADTYDIIVTDILMPIMNGDEALLEAGVPSSTKVILLTALDDDMEERVKMLRDKGINVIDWVEKPITAKSLNELLEKLCDGN